MSVGDWDKEPPTASGAVCVSRPSLDVGPVPARSAADGPTGFGEQVAVAPHLDGVALDAESGGDVIGADGFAGHADIMPCNVRVDKCNVRSYSTGMRTFIQPTTHWTRYDDAVDAAEQITGDNGGTFLVIERTGPRYMVLSQTEWNSVCAQVPDGEPVYLVTMDAEYGLFGAPL